MPSICVPVTKGNFNFLQVFHPDIIKFTNKDTLGLAFGSIIKYHYQSYKKVDEKILRSIYPLDIEIHFAKYYFRRNSKISSRCVRAINCKIESMIQFELNVYIRKVMKDEPKAEIRTKIYEFLQIYGLSDDSKYVATLERQNRRFRTKVGELKK